jgi:thioredoxin 1
MITRRAALLACLAAACARPSAAMAEAAEPFDRAAFDAAVAAGGPVVVHVHASWCPICRAQAPILEALRTQPRFGGFRAFRIDFDGDKAAVRAVGARLQSTLIVYAARREVARTVGDREEGWIEELLEKALAAL